MKLTRLTSFKMWNRRIVFILLVFSALLVFLFSRQYKYYLNINAMIASETKRNEVCTETILQLINSTFDEEMFCRLSRLCNTQTTTANNDRKQLFECKKTEHVFSQIFHGSNFRDVTCQETVVGPPEVDRGLVALASFPGSGNTWTRLLVEKLTGEYFDL